jgi:ATP-dependent DNA ligase
MIARRTPAGIVEGTQARRDRCHTRSWLPVCFVAIDLLWLNGEDLRPLPLVERKKRLRRLLRRRCNHLITMAMAVDQKIG